MEDIEQAEQEDLGQGAIAPQQEMPPQGMM